MTAPAIWLVATLFAAAAIFTVLLLLPTKDGSSRPAGEDDGISVSAEGSIVTVRKVGRVTSVVIRPDIHDHMEGGDSIELPELPIEVTRMREPELFAEYVSPETSAVRKYEIADDLYSRGYTLPWIKGLNEQYKKEMEKAKEGGGRNVRHPANLGRKDDGHKELSPNRALMGVRQPDMGDGDTGNGTSDKE